jgi:hypothetical protein
MLNPSNREPTRSTTAHPSGPRIPRGELPRHKRLALGILLISVLGTVAIQATLVRQLAAHVEAEKPVPSGVPVVSRPCGEPR